MSEIKYPEVEIRLTGNDGNALMIMGRVSRALRVAGVDPDEIAEFRQEAMSGDYGHLLTTAERWVTVL